MNTQYGVFVEALRDAAYKISCCIKPEFYNAHSFSSHPDLPVLAWIESRTGGRCFTDHLYVGNYITGKKSKLRTEEGYQHFRHLFHKFEGNSAKFTRSGEGRDGFKEFSFNFDEILEMPVPEPTTSLATES